MKYWIIFKNSLQANFAYRFNFFVGIITSGLSLVVFAYIWFSIYRNGGSMGTYSLKALMTYYITAAIMHTFITGGVVAWNIGDEIREGRISSFLVKPVSYFGTNLAKDLGRVVSSMVMYFPLILLLIVIMGFGVNWQKIPIFIVSACLALMMNFTISYIIGVSTFYFGFVMGLNFTMSNIIWFFSGELVPLDLLPDFWRNIAIYSPFKYISYFPNQIVNGRVSLNNVEMDFTIGFAWLLVLLLLAFATYRRGLKRFEGEGI